MPFLVHLPDGTKVNPDDLPFEQWGVISDAAGVPWWEVSYAPVANPAGAVALLNACARFVGQEPPVGWLTAANVLTVFEKVEDDMPGTFEDGIPKAGDDPTTSLSSGSSEPSDGPLT